MGDDRPATGHSRRSGRSITAADTASEAAIDITELDTTILNDGRGRVTVTIRVFNVGFDAVDYDGQVTLSAGATTYETINIRGQAGAGADADERTLRLETNGEPPTEALVTAALSNGDQEQQTVQFTGSDPGPGSPASVEIVDCSTEPAFNGGLNVTFSVDGTAGENFTATVRVDGMVVDSQEWTVGSRTPTEYEQIVDPSDLPTGEDMPVEVGIAGNFRDCGTVTVGSEPPDDPDPIDPIDPPSEPTLDDISVSCGGIPEEVERGRTLTVPYTVSNAADTSVTVDVALITDGSVQDTNTTFVASGRETTDQFLISFGGTGRTSIDLEATEVR